MDLAARIVAMNSSCFRRQLDCFLGGSGFGFMGLTVEISVPSALCLPESNTFLLLAAVFWQIGTCFFRTFGKKLLPHILQGTSSSEVGGDSKDKNKILKKATDHHSNTWFKKSTHTQNNEVVQCVWVCLISG